MSTIDDLRAVVWKLSKIGRLEAWASTLDAADLALVEQIVADAGAEQERRAESRVHWRADPARMGAHLAPGRGPGQVTLWPYVELVGEAFARCTQAEAGRLIVNLPAQYGKSTICSQWGPAWELDRHPDRNIILSSYGDDLADRNALAVRDILDRHGDVLRARLRRDQRRQDRFSTPEGGGVLAAGIRSAATGFPAWGIVIDDPFKDWVEAHSEARRTLVWNQYRSVFYMRRTNDAAWIVVVMTRWHEGDLSGRLQQEAWDHTGEEFEIVRLPEVAEAPDPDATNPLLRVPDLLGREPGQLLEPERFGERSVASKQLVLGPYLWAGMSQQRPAPEEGTDILRAWFKVDDDVLPAKADEAITSWDMKLKDTEAGDYVVGQCWWRVGGAYWLMDQLRGQWNEATTKVAMALMAVRHPEATTHFYENTGNAPELTRELRRAQKDYEVPDVVADLLAMTPDEREAVTALLRHGMSSLQKVTPKGDKRIRMRAQTPLIAGGNVHLPGRAHWVPIYLEEMAAFPNGNNDDQVDCTSQALSKLARGGASLQSAPEGTRVPSSPSAVPGGGSVTTRGGSAVPRGSSVIVPRSGR